LMRPVRW